jgi:hypothetical protein
MPKIETLVTPKESHQIHFRHVRNSLIRQFPFAAISSRHAADKISSIAKTAADQAPLRRRTQSHSGGS